MATEFRNYIAGEWIAGTSVTVNRNPSDLADVVGEYAQADAAQARDAIAAAKAGVPGVGARLDPGACEHPRPRRHRDPRAQGRARSAAVARGRQDAAGRHRRGDARRADLQVLRRRSAASCGRARAVGAPGRRMSRSRASRSASSASSRRGTFRSRFPRGRSRRRSPTATASCSSRPISCPAARGRSPTSSRARALPAGVFNLVMGRGSVVGEALVNHPDVDAISFTGSVADGPRDRRQGGRAHGQGAARDGRQEPAGRARRRRPRHRGQRRGAGLVFLDRPALHGVVAPHRHRGHPRPLRRGGRRKSSRTLKVDDALAAGTDIGPVVDQSQLDQDLDYVEIGRARRRASSSAAASA